MFDFRTEATFTTVGENKAGEYFMLSSGQPETRRSPKPQQPSQGIHDRRPGQPDRTAGAADFTKPRTIERDASKSLSLYTPDNSELHHIADLAKAVIDRYDIVHRRRAARLARERAARQAQYMANPK
jgi:hypothetical protein